METYGGFFLAGIFVFAAFIALMLTGLPVVRAIRGDGVVLSSDCLWGISVGLTLYGTALVLLGFAALYKPASCAILLLPGPLFFFLRRKAEATELLRCIKESIRCAVTDVPAACVTIASVAVILPAVVAPEIFYDALFYHLGLPSQYLLTGLISAPPDVVHASFPASLDLIFGAALALGGTAAAKWLGLLLFLLALAATAELAKTTADHTEGGERWYAVALLACVPGVAIMSTLSSVDVGMAFAGAMALVVFVQSRRLEHGDGFRHLLLAAFPLALLAGSKYTGLYLVATLTPLLLIGPSSTPFRDRFKGAAAMAGLALLLASPWYLRNLMLHGNPVYPAFPSLFGGTEAGAYAMERIARDLPRFGASETGELIGALLTGKLGAGSDLGLLLPLCFIAMAALGFTRRQWIPIATASALFILLWMTGPKATRYLYPVFPAFAVAGGIVLAAISTRGRQWRIGVVCLLLAAASFNMYRIYLVEKLLYSPKGELASLLSGGSSRADYLTTVVPYTSMARWANDNLPKDAVILLVGETRPLYFERRVIFSSAYDTPRLVQWVTEYANGVDLAARLRKEGVTHILVNGSELSRLRKNYGYMVLSEKDSEKIKAMMGTVKHLHSVGTIRLGELPAI